MTASICRACVVGVIVTQVRAHQHQRRCVAPHLRERGRDVLRRDRAEHERQQREIVEQHLQERQLNFQAVLLRVRRIGLDDVAALQRAATSARRSIATASERRRERTGGGHRHAAQIHAMTRADEHDAANDLPQRCNRRVRGRGDAAGIDVARVRHDQRLRRRGRCQRGAVLSKVFRHDVAQLAFVVGIEQARDGRRPMLVFPRSGRMIAS